MGVTSKRALNSSRVALLTRMIEGPTESPSSETPGADTAEEASSKAAGSAKKKGAK